MIRASALASSRRSARPISTASTIDQPTTGHGERANCEVVDKGQGSRPRKDTGTYEARQRVGEGKVTSDRPNRRIPAWRVTNVPDDVSPVDGTVGVLYH